MAIEEAGFETPKPLGAATPFPPRRRFLKSETFRTLVQIFSICHNEPQRFHANGIAPDQTEQGDGSEESAKEIGAEVCDKLVGLDSTKSENSLVQDTVVDGNISQAFLAREDEPKHILNVKGNEELAHGDCTIPSISSPDNGQIVDDVPSIINHNDHAEFQQHANAEQLCVDNEQQSCDVSEVFESSVDKDIITRVYELGETDQGKNSSFRENRTEEAVHDVQQTVVEIEKSVCTGATIGSAHCLTTDGEIEVGELSQAYGLLIDMFNGDDVPSMINHNSHADFQQHTNAEQLHVDNEHKSCKVSEIFESSVDEDIINRVSKQGEADQAKSSSFRWNTKEEAKHDVQQTIMEIEKSVFTDATICSSHYPTTDGEIRERELSQDYGLLIDMINGDDVPSMINHNNHADFQQHANARQLHVDNDHESCNVSSEVFESSVDKDIITRVSKLDETNQGKSYPFRWNTTEEAEHGMQGTVMEMEKSVCTGAAIGSGHCPTTDGEIEERELSQDYGLPIDMFNGDDIPSMANHNDHADFQQHADAGKLCVDNEHQNCKVSEVFGSSVDKDIITRASKLGETDQGKSSPVRWNTTEEAEHDMQQTVMEIEKSVCTGATIGSGRCPTVDGEIEEGELSQDYCPLIDVFPGDAVALGEKVEDELISDDVIIEGDCAGIERNGANEIHNESTPYFDTNQDKSSSLSNTTDEADNDTRKKVMEVETSGATKGYGHYLTADGDIEEGELSESLGLSIEFFLEDTVALGEISGEEQISKNIMNNEDCSGSNLKGAKVVDNESASHFSTIKSGITEELKQSNRSKMEYEHHSAVHEETPMAKREGKAGRYRKQDSAVERDFDCLSARPGNLVLHGEMSRDYTTDNHGIASTKKDAGSNKRKRGTSQKSKEKKKRAKRMKRAEKNKQLGVRRLKLPMILKPKTETYCHHYLKGRCHKGDECKFSHDTVPLTKSSPCCHFARQACMKGDVCPFDHQLSKYPCNNYVSNGFCNRGDKCLFSHKIPFQEGFPTASNFSKSDVKSSPLGNSNSKKQLNANGSSYQNVNAYSSGIFPQKNGEQNVAERVLKLPGQTPEGKKSLTFGKPPSGYSCKMKEAGASPKRDDGLTVGNQTNKSASEIFLDLIPKGASPAVAPKGINFLSFGKASLMNSCKMQPSKPPQKGKGIEPSPADDSSKCKKGDLSVRRGDSAEVGYQANRGELDLVQSLKGSTNRATSLAIPPGISFPSFGKAPLDDSSCKKQASLPSIMDGKIGTSIQNTLNASDEPHIPSEMPLRLAASPLISGNSSGLSADWHNKSKSSLSQKALLTTLAFAAKYESEVKMDQSIHAPAVSTEVNKESGDSSISGSSQNGSMKASKILDFLYGIRSKTKK
ncbi:uncharacterized protein LOC131161721 [Malania oleifera]|uniref:uncharacterized protein LOC131161721 n=1 Tax=Malania oleifera TaxID=397392 RepID=UPI0025AE4813|nr:uncharacterized protein LOC131161721 [Malania oleifera]